MYFTALSNSTIDRLLGFAVTSFIFTFWLKKFNDFLKLYSDKPAFNYQPEKMNCSNLL
jgi:hypothetical protein